MSNSEKELMRKKRKVSDSSCEAANNIQWLPREVVRDIAARLPVKSLVRFKAVSKWWRCLISDSSFVDQHHANAIANISKHPRFAVFIETRDVLDDHHARLITYLINHHDQSVSTSIQIQHTIEHRIRSRNNYPLFICSRYFSYFRGIFMLGIDSFSLWNPSLGEKKDIPISPMGGCLGLAAKQVSRTITYDGIWIMKEFGVKESWTKLMDIPSSGSRRRRPMCFAKNGEVLVSMEYDNNGGSWFGNLKDRIKLPVRVWEDRGCTSYVESLVSLNLHPKS